MPKFRPGPDNGGRVFISQGQEIDTELLAQYAIYAAITMVVLSLLYWLVLYSFQRYLNRNPLELVRLIRMICTLDSDPVRKLNDHLAPLFTSYNDRFLNSIFPFRYMVLYVLDWKHPGLYDEILGRCRLWEQEITNLVNKIQVAGKQGTFKQLVIIQSGDETIGIRLAHLFQERGIAVFEVDSESVHASKRARLGMANVNFNMIHTVSCDMFSTEAHTGSLLTALQRSNDFDPSKHTIWLWQTIFPHRRSELLDEVFRTVRQISVYGSLFCFDLLVGSAEEFTGYGAAEAQEYLQQYDHSLGGVAFDIENNGLIILENYLCDRGFDLLLYFGPKEMAMRMNGMHSMSQFVSFAIAEVLQEEEVYLC
jgi:O-methyltransferase involved in polyketide biosynthesis